eukprot:5422323-Pyramimonas_sp.AAC.1
MARQVHMARQVGTSQLADPLTHGSGGGHFPVGAPLTHGSPGGHVPVGAEARVLLAEALGVLPPGVGGEE